MKSEFAADVFAVPKDNSFSSSVNQIYQTFDGQELYPALEEKAAMLLYAGILSAIDNKISINNSTNNNLEQQIKALYNHCFTDKNNIVEISDLIDVRDGTHDSPKPQVEGKKLITSKHLLKYVVDISSANFITEEDYKKINERSLVSTNDILISVIGTVGIVSYIIENPVDFAVKNIGIYRTSQKKRVCLLYSLFLE